jgi:UDP-glucose 4-epimerase
MKNIKGKKFLVIGGAGFIGSHVVDQLLEADASEVIIYDNFARGRMDNLKEALKDPRCKIYELGGDILQTDILEKAMEGVHGVFHLAAMWLLHCYDFPRTAFDVNIRGTFNVIEAAVKMNVKKIIYSSSASVYGNAVEIPMTEDHLYNNETFYGATKIAGEHMFKSLSSRYGIEWCGLRYMNVYGPRQDYKGTYIAVMHKILDRLQNNLSPIVFGDGSQQYDFVDVKDVAYANLCAMSAEKAGECYNVGRGIGTSIKELCELLIELSGSDQKIQYEPAGLTFVTNRIGSTKKAQTEIGFKWTVDLRDGMQRLIKWRNSHLAELEARREESL